MLRSLSPSSSEACPVSGETPIEELVNSLTHGLGLLLSIVGVAALIALSWAYGNLYHIVSCSIYGSTLILLYGASMWYHSCRELETKRALKILDHICIYLLIAGSYTPFTLGPLKGVWGWSTLAVIWSLALVGSMIKIRFTDVREWVSVSLYLLMGWLVLAILFPLSYNLSTNGFFWLFAGGFFYSFGTIFFMWDSLPFAHSIWHLFVMMGSVCHYFCILFHIVPYN